MPKNRKIIFDDEVFFEIAYNRKSEKEFLRWASRNGQRWSGGSVIKETDDFLLHHISVNSDGTFSNVPVSTWMQGRSKALCIDLFAFLKSNGELDDKILSECCDAQLKKINYMKSLI